MLYLGKQITHVRENCIADYRGAQERGRDASYSLKLEIKVGILVGVTSELSLNLMVPGRRTGTEEAARGERKSPAIKNASQGFWWET